MAVVFYIMVMVGIWFGLNRIWRMYSELGASEQVHLTGWSLSKQVTGLGWDPNIFDPRYVLIFANLLGDLTSVAYGQGCALRVEVCGVVSNVSSNPVILGGLWKDVYVLSSSDAFTLSDTEQIVVHRSLFSTNISVMETFSVYTVTMSGLVQFTPFSTKILGICYRQDSKCSNLDDSINSLILGHMLTAELLVCHEYDFQFTF